MPAIGCDRSSRERGGFALEGAAGRGEADKVLHGDGVVPRLSGGPCAPCCFPAGGGAGTGAQSEVRSADPASSASTRKVGRTAMMAVVGMDMYRSVATLEAIREVRPTFRSPWLDVSRTRAPPPLNCCLHHRCSRKRLKHLQVRNLLQDQSMAIINQVERKL